MPASSGSTRHERGTCTLAPALSRTRAADRGVDVAEVDALGEVLGDEEALPVGVASASCCPQPASSAAPAAAVATRRALLLVRCRITREILPLRHLLVAAP